MEKGEPPSEEIERDWLKILRDEERRLQEHEEKRLVCKSFITLIGDTVKHFNIGIKYDFPFINIR